MECDTLQAVEWIIKSNPDHPIPPETILALVDRIHFLEARQTELQARNTDLVIENRELAKKLQEKQRTIQHCLSIMEDLKA